MLADFSDPKIAADTIADAFERLQSNGIAIREELIRGARAYSWDEVADRYVDVYVDAMTPRGEPRQLSRQRGQVA
jgi:alpha-1,3-mannosyltransferase